MTWTVHRPHINIKEQAKSFKSNRRWAASTARRDKLDIIGEKLSSLIIHYYARIKTTPDFIDLNIDMPLDQARKIVKQVLDNAMKLNQLSDMIVEQTQRQLNK